MWGLGSLSWDQGKSAETMTYCERAHENLEALLGPQHNNVQSLHDLLLDMIQHIQSELIEEASLLHATGPAVSASTALFGGQEHLNNNLLGTLVL